jgi:hypothetical protein
MLRLYESFFKRKRSTETIVAVYESESVRCIFESETCTAMLHYMKSWKILSLALNPKRISSIPSNAKSPKYSAPGSTG